MIFRILLVLGICSTPLVSAFTARQLLQLASPWINAESLVVGYTSDYFLAWNDRGSGGRRDGSLYVPLAQSGYSLVGTLAVPGYSAPTRSVIVLHSSTSTLYARPARSFTRVYADFGTGANRDGSVWRPVCDVGYYSVSDFGQSGYSWPGSLYAGVDIRPCIYYTCVVSCSSHSVWDDKGTGGSQDITFWKFQRSGTDGATTPSDGFFRAPGDYNQGSVGALAYCINPKCITSASKATTT